MLSIVLSIVSTIVLSIVSMKQSGFSFVDSLSETCFCVQ